MGIIAGSPPVRFHNTHRDGGGNGSVVTPAFPPWPYMGSAIDLFSGLNNPFIISNTPLSYLEMQYNIWLGVDADAVYNDALSVHYGQAKWFRDAGDSTQASFMKDTRANDFSDTYHWRVSLDEVDGDVDHRMGFLFDGADTLEANTIQLVYNNGTQTLTFKAINAASTLVPHCRFVMVNGY